MPSRAEQLAQRVEDGAQEMITAVQSLSNEQWNTLVAAENRPVGVLVHHVAVSYPDEAALITVLATEGGFSDVDWDAVDADNANHAVENEGVDKETAITLLRQNSVIAADTVRGLSDAQLDRVAPNSLHWDAPMTVQFFVEQHPIAHPYIHLENIRKAVKG
jgi:hypothetical protein